MCHGETVYKRTVILEFRKSCVKQSLVEKVSKDGEFLESRDVGYDFGSDESVDDEDAAVRNATPEERDENRTWSDKEPNLTNAQLKELTRDFIESRRKRFLEQRCCGAVFS